METAFEQWVSAEALRFGLELARMTGLVAVAPLSWSFAPVRLRASLAMLATFALHGTVTGGSLDFSVGRLFLGIFSELALGATLGFVARLALAVGEIAADSIAPAMGLGAAQMFDPTLGGQGTVLSKLIHYVALLVALTTGLHHLALGALFHSFEVVGPGALVSARDLAPAASTMVSETIVSGVTLALPFLVVLLIAQVALAFIARAAPQMQIFAVGFGVTLGVGTLLWLSFAPDIVSQLAFQTEVLRVNMGRVLEAVRGTS